MNTASASRRVSHDNRMATSLITNTNTAQVPLLQPNGISIKKAHTNDRDEQQRGSNSTSETRAYWKQTA